jgi:hypothetical protein
MYISSLKMLLRFLATTIEDSVNHSFFDVLGTNTAVSVSDAGYKMEPHQYLKGEIDLAMSEGSSISNSLTITFSLYPVSPGLAINPYTDLAEAVRMPILSLTRTESRLDIPVKI